MPRSVIPYQTPARPQQGYAGRLPRYAYQSNLPTFTSRPPATQLIDLSMPLKPFTDLVEHIQSFEFQFNLVGIVIALIAIIISLSVIAKGLAK